MKKTLLALAALATATASAQTTAQSVTVRPAISAPIELGLSAGYANGLSGEAFVHAPYLYGPFGVKAGVAYASVGNFNYDRNSSNLLIAGASIFCLDIGGCSTSGNNVIIGLDGTYALGEFAPGLDADLYAGVRYGLFNRTLTYSGQSLTYNMNAFGLGGGLLLGYAINPGLSLFGDLGADYFFGSAITSTGGGSTVTTNPNDADYNALRAFTNMPAMNLKARIGVKFRL